MIKYYLLLIKELIMIDGWKTKHNDMLLRLSLIKKKMKGVRRWE